MQQGIANLDGIEILVLDEADRMFDMGFLPDVRRIIERIPRERQTMMFSATFPSDVERLAQFALRQPKRVAVGLIAPAKTVSHAFYPVPQHLKAKLLVELLKKTDAFSMLVFTRTKHKASRLAKVIQKEGFKTAALHGDKSQNQRQQALDQFKKGKVQVLVATDIAARGIDVETVSHVINYDVPDTADTYIHRIGRTGRAEREGDAFTLITPEDNEEVRMIERALKSNVERKMVAGFDYDAPKPEQPAVSEPMAVIGDHARRLVNRSAREPQSQRHSHTPHTTPAPVTHSQTRRPYARRAPQRGR
jgi:ATP-dependent RNA helicase RhlE